MDQIAQHQGIYLHSNPTLMKMPLVAPNHGIWRRPQAMLGVAPNQTNKMKALIFPNKEITKYVCSD